MANDRVSSTKFLHELPHYPLTECQASFFQLLEQGTFLLEAEPGAGKSTLAPLWVLAHLNGHQINGHQKILLVQPRVLAAQSLAQRLADLVGDELGATVGYQVPFDYCATPSTRLLVITPGILLQYLLQDSTLEDVGCVILDEIHERSINQDLAWAWLQETQILRDDIHIILMSATPDPQLQHSIPHRLFTAGRCFPVSTQYLPPKSQNSYPEKIEDQVLRALQSYSDWSQSTTLIFLPGWNEIEKCAEKIRTQFPSHSVFRLHSRVPMAEQKRALNTALGARIILSTNIAETSLTIADVTLVIDSGLVRRADYEQRTGISRLRLSKISQASADQRRGRAGRVQAGHCIRLWSQDQPLAAADLPEIRTTDYLPFALRLAHWGSPVDSLVWLESPNKLALTLAQQQLQQLNLLDANKQITPAGKQVSALGTHPRVAALLLAQQDTISEPLLLLALALHFDSATELSLHALFEWSAAELKQHRPWQQQQKRWLQHLKLTVNKSGALDSNAIAQAYNDRIGFRQENGKYRLNSGISVESLDGIEAPWAVFPFIFPKAKGNSGIGIAVAMNAVLQRSLSQESSQLVYKQNRWQLLKQWHMGGVVVAEELISLAAEKIPALLISSIQDKLLAQGLNALPWRDDAKRLLQRARIVSEKNLLTLPDLSDHHLIARLNEWLQPFLNAQSQWHELPWGAALEFYLGYDNCQQIAQWLPDKIELPSGRQVTVDFSAEGIPQVSAKLQEFFGCEDLQLANGKLPLRIHLLSPNGSPLAITMDLRSFWQQAYVDVKKEMRGRYPRHPWPDNPLEHAATALTKRKLAMQSKP